MDDDSWKSHELAEWFAANQPFASLPQEARDHLLGVSVLFAFQPGELILKQRSTQASFLWGVLEGEVRLYEYQQWSMEVPCLPGQVFGVASLLKEGPQPYNALVSLPSVCVRIPADAFASLCEEYESFREHFGERFVGIAPNLPDIGGWVGGHAGSPYTAIQQYQGAGSWGSVLDAGTGMRSLSWLISQPTERWSAVTSVDKWADWLKDILEPQFREQDRLILGNWKDPKLLQEEVFDVVLCDHLIGALERHSPGFQYNILERLRPHVGNRLYVVGYQPVHEPDTPGGEMILEALQTLNICLMLAKKTPYREYPEEWVVKALQQSGFSVRGVQHFPLIYGIRYVHGLLNESLTLLKEVEDSLLCLAMAKSIRKIRERAQATDEFDWGVRYHHEYLILAEPA